MKQGIVKVACAGCGKTLTYNYLWFIKNVSETTIFHCSEECLMKVTQ